MDDFRGDGSYEGPQFRGWKVDTWLEVWMGNLPWPGWLHGKCDIFHFDFDFIYEMDLVMEVGRSDGTIAFRELNHFCRTS